MSDELPALTELIGAGSAFEAELIVGALRSLDIPAVTQGSLPADEFAMSHKLMGHGIRIRHLAKGACPQGSPEPGFEKKCPDVLRPHFIRAQSF